MHGAAAFRSFVLVLLALSALPAVDSSSADEQEPKPLTWQDAVDLLEHEKSLAENRAGLLKTYAPNQQVRVEGQKLYGEAKAAFDGLIGRLEADLAVNRDPEDSPELKAKLEAAAQQRVALVDYVDGAIDQAEPGKKNLIVEAVVESAGELVDALFGGAIEIWKEYGRRGEVRRKTLATLIQKTRWRPFTEVEAAL
jgi:hypothetical protein